MNRGRNSRTCSSRRVTLFPAARAITLNRRGSERTTSSVWRPMEPVEPSTASRIGFTTEIGKENGYLSLAMPAPFRIPHPPLQHQPYHKVVYQRRCQEDAVQADQETPMSRDKIARILDSRPGFNQGLPEV